MTCHVLADRINRDHWRHTKKTAPNISSDDKYENIITVKSGKNRAIAGRSLTNDDSDVAIQPRIDGSSDEDCAADNRIFTIMAWLACARNGVIIDSRALEPCGNRRSSTQPAIACSCTLIASNDGGTLARDSDADVDEVSL